MNRILFEAHEVDLSEVDPSRGIAVLGDGDPRARHLVEILRARRGDRLAVGLVNGPRGTATYGGLRGREHHLEVEWESNSESDLFPIVSLLGHARPIVMKRILRDLTTIGVGTIVVCGTELGEKSYLRSNLWSKQEYRGFLVEGAAQAGGTHLPAIERAYTVQRGIAAAEAAASGAAPLRLLFSEDEGGAAPAAELFRGAVASPPTGFTASVASGAAAAVGEPAGRTGAPAPILFAVGNERGFTERECSQLTAAGYSPVSLGPRTLRTETAASAAAVIVQQLLRSRG